MPARGRWVHGAVRGPETGAGHGKANHRGHGRWRASGHRRAGVHEPGRRRQHHAVNRVAANAFLHVHADQIAIEHRGGAHQHFAGGHHRELQRPAARLPHAFLHEIGDLAEVRVAGVQLAPGVADANHRAAIKQIVRVALIFHPRAMRKAILVDLAEPLLAAAFEFAVVVAVGHAELLLVRLFYWS